MKNFYLVFLFAYSFASFGYAQSDAESVDTRFVSQVRSASIEVVQGETIYANGNMQSQLRINYQFKNGVSLVDLKLKEFGSKEDLSKIGWMVSDIDKGFDHNISAGTRSRRHAHGYPSNPFSTVKAYQNKFVSTKLSNEMINICFELTTKSADNQNQVYSTCEDEGIMDGTAQITSARPKYYNASDFTLRKINDFINATNDVEAGLYTVTPDLSIPSGLHFRLKNKQYAPTYFLDNAGGVLNYPIRLAGNNPPSVSHTTTWILNPEKDTTVQLFDKTRKLREFSLPTTYYHQAIMHLVHVKYKAETVIASSWRCNTPKGTATIATVVICAVAQGGGGASARKLWTTEVLPLLGWKKSHQVVLIDNYGTEHPISLRVGSLSAGIDNLTIS